jgi:hypothetical protein
MVSTSHEYCTNKQYTGYEMFNPSAALFANTMLMFRLMFFHIKKPAEAGFIMLQCLFSGTSPVN